MKAVIACAHKIHRIIYKLLSTKQTYQKEKALELFFQIMTTRQTGGLSQGYKSKLPASA